MKHAQRYKNISGQNRGHSKKNVYFCGANQYGHLKPMAAKAREALTPADILTEYLHRTKRRRTPERFMVLAGAEAMGGHFTVEQLGEYLQNRNQHLATATVYSGLQLLVDAGLLRRLRLGDGAMHYELTGGNLFHLMCVRCGKIKDVRDPGMEELLRTRRYSAFTPAYFALSVYGVCSGCARKARKQEQERKNKLKDNISKTKK